MAVKSAPQGPVRVVDVAAAAGVSPATASKALNNTGQLSESTRRRVREVAERLGFTERERERDPSRTVTVALLTGDSVGRFSLPILLGAENALSLGQIMVLLCDTRDDPARKSGPIDARLDHRPCRFGCRHAGRHDPPGSARPATLAEPLCFSRREGRGG